MALSNKEIYKKTIGFSLWRLLWDVITFLILAGTTIAGFLLSNAIINNGLVGLAIGFVVGIIILVFILRYVSYSYKAGQIAMMTKGVSEGKLPDDVISEGKKIVKERFATVAAYYVVTGAIKGIFRQIGRGITAIGQAVGGDSGSTVGSVIAGVIDTIIAYLCDCCLGWVFYRSNEKATKATLEGAVLFFKHGKTFLKNMGRVFGFGILSFIVIGGVFTGMFYLIFAAFPDAFTALSKEIIEVGSDVPSWVSDITTLTWACAGISGIIMWAFIHSTFVRPFVLVGVLRNYIESGENEKISEKDFDELDAKSAKFKKLRAEA